MDGELIIGLTDTPIQVVMIFKSADGTLLNQFSHSLSGTNSRDYLNRNTLIGGTTASGYKTVIT